MRPMAFYLLPSDGVKLHGKGVRDTDEAPPLDSRGESLPALLDYFLRRDRRRFFEYVDALKKRVPGLEDLHIATPTEENRQVDLVIDGGLVLPPESVSVGVRLLIFYLALTYHPRPPKVILLEEPENGVHPKRLADIVALLRDITKGTHCGHPAQIILTTHSPYLLDNVKLDEDQVLVFSRNDDGSRSVEAADAERLKVFLDEFMLGEVWYNEGEAGLVKKQP